MEYTYTGYRDTDNSYLFSLLQLDVSGDRFPDCIIRGPYSMLFMVEVRYGTTMWHLHMQNKDTGVCFTLLHQNLYL